MNALVTEAPVGQPIIIQSRMLDAPIDLVWEAMTRPEHVEHWWGPRIMKTTVDILDVRVGGRWRIIHTTPDGRAFAFHGEYREVVPPRRIVQTFGVEGMFSDRIIVETLTLELIGDRTQYKVVSLFESVADRDGMIASGMEGGARESMERLDELLAMLKRKLPAGSAS
ncbi:MAG TPA: SRPBCC family protein [Bauldia sp.]|nr:SRPBCC family protein [Bauldia sp.]